MFQAEIRTEVVFFVCFFLFCPVPFFCMEDKPDNVIRLVMPCSLLRQNWRAFKEYSFMFDSIYMLHDESDMGSYNKLSVTVKNITRGL